jgi:LPXTG-motif cell wall-anchored protein
MLGGLGTASALETDQGNVTWGVRPATADGPDSRTAFDFQAAPGTLIEDWIAVTNFSEQPASFRVYASDATTDYDTAAFTLIGAEQASTDLGAWTVVESGPSECPDTNDQAEEVCAHDLGVRITLDGGETRVLPFAVTVPHDATPGDHSAGVVASFEQETAEDDGTTVLLEQRVGARIYLRVDGPLEAGVNVAGVTASYDGTINPFGRGAAIIGFDVTNTGNVRLSGLPAVRVTGPFGLDLGALDLEPVANLLPGGTGHVTARVPAIAPVFLLAAKVTVTPTAGDGSIAETELDVLPATGSAQAWAVPWSALVLIALISGGTWFVVWRRRRYRRLLAAELAQYTDEILAGAEARAGGQPARSAAGGAAR